MAAVATTRLIHAISVTAVDTLLRLMSLPHFAPPEPTMTEKHLLFAVLAFESDLIDLAQLTAACRAWAADKSKPLADLLVERGWMTAEDRGFVEKQLDRKLAKHQHDPRVTLNAITRGDVCDAIKEVADPDIQQSLSSWPSSGPVLLEALEETLLETELPKSRYTWLSEVGRGGRGRVWLARDNDLSREVALKELIPGSATNESVRRLIKEAQITGQLQHPNIVPVYEVNRGGQPFYTMKLVKGETLSQVVQRHHAQRRVGQEDPKTMPELLRIFLCICDALAYAHSRGIIHRDLKPRNIVLGEYGEAIVLDWGLARQLGTAEETSAPIVLTEDGHTEATIAGQTLGTPGYMSPEQASGRIDLLDHRTDIYGLGAILFEILTGHAPHEHRTPSARGENQTAHTLTTDDLLRATKPPRAASSIAVLLHQISTGETPHVRDLEPSIPADLDAICAQAMAKSRDERYQTVKELKAALLEFQVHKESIDLATSAAAQLARAKHSDNYQHFNSALVGFEEALRQWPSNPEANVGIEETLVAYAQMALKHGDFDLGLSLLDANERQHAETRTKLLMARKKRDADMRNAKWGKVTKWVIPLMTPFLVLLVVAAKGQFDLQAAFLAKRQAEAARDQAEAERQLVVIAMQRAEVLRITADKKRFEAEQAAADANIAKLKAYKDTQMAEKAAELAESIREAADAAKRKAIEDAIQAANRTKQAELASARSELAAKNAELAKQKADYRAGLADASRAFFEGNYGSTRQKLSHLKSHYADLCGPEWNHLMNAVSVPQAVSMSKPVESMSLSRDGRTLVCGDSAGHVTVWLIDAEKKRLDVRPIRQMDVGSRLRVVAMSPNGQEIAAAGHDGLIRVWSLTDAAKKPPVVLKGHTKAVNTLKFSADGTRLASGSDDHTVRLWALDSATMIVGKRTSFPVTSLDWSRGGTILVAATYGSNPRDESPTLFRPLRLIPVPMTPPAIDKVPTAQEDRFIADVEDEPPGFARAYSWEVVTKDNTVNLNQLCTFDGPDSDKLALRSYALKQLRSRADPPDQVTDGEWEAFLLQALREGSRTNDRWKPTAIALTSDGRFAVCNGLNSEIYLWQANARGADVQRIGRETRHVVTSVKLGSHSHRMESVRSLAFAPDDSRLLAAGDDGVISLWDRQSGGALPNYKRSQLIYGHGGSVRSCLPLPQSPDLIVSGSYDQQIHILDLKTYFKSRESYQSFVSPRDDSENSRQ